MVGIAAVQAMMLLTARFAKRHLAANIDEDA
jgi:hypothetical protein